MNAKDMLPANIVITYTSGKRHQRHNTVAHVARRMAKHALTARTLKCIHVLVTEEDGTRTTHAYDASTGHWTSKSLPTDL